MLDIILRTCDRVEKFSTHNNKPRPFGSKPEVIKKCHDSLLKSIAYANLNGIDIRLFIIDDHSSQETKDYLNSFNNMKIFELEETGNGESLLACYEYARDHCEDLCFFIEDDYLFEETAIYECYRMYESGRQMYEDHICIHPVDYPDRYTKPYPCYVFTGENRHWRTIKHTTGTFLISHAILIDQWEHYMKFCKLGIEPGINEDVSINRVYEKYPCLSPIPSLAEHYQEHFTLSPYFKQNTL